MTTHDLPPTAGYLAGEQVRLRDSLGLLTRPVDEELAAAKTERAAWIAELRRVGLLAKHADVEHTILALYQYLGQNAVAATGSLTRPTRSEIGAPRTQPGTHRRVSQLADSGLSGPDGQPVMLEDVFSASQGNRAG